MGKRQGYDSSKIGTNRSFSPNSTCRLFPTDAWHRFHRKTARCDARSCSKVIQGDISIFTGSPTVQPPPAFAFWPQKIRRARNDVLVRQLNAGNIVAGEGQPLRRGLLLSMLLFFLVVSI